MDTINRENINAFFDKIKRNEWVMNSILCGIALIIYVIGRCIPKFNVILVALLLFWINNLIHGIIHIKQKIYFLFFNLTLGLFLISRPVVLTLRGQPWWVNCFDDTLFGLNGVIVALVSLFIGSKLYDLWQKKKKKEVVSKVSFLEKNRNTIAVISLGIFLLSFVSRMDIEIQKFIFMRGKNYVEFYTGYSHKIPLLISIFSGMLDVSICVFLLTKPKKKISYFVLMLYVIQTIPILLVGERGKFVSSAIFAFLYVFYRSIQEKEQEIWFGKCEKILTIMSIPIMLIGLGTYNYIRDNKDVPTISPIGIIADFLYSQGTSFDTLCKCHGLMEEHLVGKGKNYTFGGFIDYIKYENAIRTHILKKEGLGSGNNEKKALESNCLSHAIAYWSDKDFYLKGHGWGSSFVIETYVDYGYFGIVIYSILMGIFLNTIMKIFNRRNFLSIYIMVSSLKLFMVPRAEATGFLQSIIQLHFWIPIIGIVMCVLILNKLPKCKEKVEWISKKI